MGFSYTIKQNAGDSHQVSAWAGITFLSFKYKDTAHNFNRNINNPQIDAINNITVTSDILSINITNTKSSFLDSAEIMLSSGNYNYQSLIFPGDHVLVWINNGFESFQNDVMSRASKNEKANEFLSGLKFIGKVNSVRSEYIFSPNGEKTLRYKLTLKAFSEFGDIIYYNQALGPNIKSNVPNAFIFQEISAKWRDYIETTRGLTDAQDLIQFCIDIFLGSGPAARGIYNRAAKSQAPNSALIVPKELLSILGRNPTNDGFSVYSDILHTIYGIQSYSSNSYLPDTQQQTHQNKLITKNKLKGNLFALPDLFNNIPLWSILQQSLNSSINEMYTALRVNSSKDIFPTFVARQIPFSSIYFDKFFIRAGLNPDSVSHTKFIDLPKWIIDPSIAIGQFNIGTSDSIRFNFFQIFGTMHGFVGGNPGLNQIFQYEADNFFIDNPDMMRNGNRPMARTTTAVLIEQNQGLTHLKEWAHIIGDCFVNGHLKLSGSLTCPGITEPICVGDNLEIAGNLFHIEGVSHSYEVDPHQSMKTFYTTINLSQGVLSNGDYIIYNDINRLVHEDVMAPGITNETIPNSYNTAPNSSFNDLNVPTDGKRELK